MPSSSPSLKLFVLMVVLFAPLAAECVRQDDTAVVVLASLQGEITPATEKYISEAISFAEKLDAKALILTIDTPGGQVASVKNIMMEIENSPVPVIGYVYPAGATAWSGGAFVLASCHIAAMAPGTSVGSAQPIEITPYGVVYVNQSKIVNAMVKMMSAAMRLHGRNATAASLFITENLNLDAAEALKNHVIEVVPEDLGTLLDWLDGKVIVKVRLETGEVRWLVKNAGEPVQGTILVSWELKGVRSARLEKVAPGPQTLILGMLTDPVVSSLLLTIGVFALLIGLKTPGVGLETLGAVMIVAAAIGLGIIGVELGGVLLLAVGILLVLSELKLQVGALAVLGVICIAAGAALMMPVSRLWVSAAELTRIMMYVVLSAAVMASIFLLVAYKAAKALRRPPAVGPETLIGAVGVAVSDLDPEGEVRVQGEIWRAVSEKDWVKRGDKVVVVRREGLKLIVRRKS